MHFDLRRTSYDVTESVESRIRLSLSERKCLKSLDRGEIFGSREKRGLTVICQYLLALFCARVYLLWWYVGGYGPSTAGAS